MNINNEQKKAEIEYKIMSKGIIPIYKNNKIFIYKISSNEKVKDLKLYLKEHMIDVDTKVLLTSNELEYKLANGFYDNMISYKKSTKQEILEYFNINDIDELINKISKDIEIYEINLDNELLRVFIPKNEIYNSNIKDNILNIYMSKYLKILSDKKISHSEFIEKATKINKPSKKDLQSIKNEIYNINERYITIKLKSQSKLYEIIDLIDSNKYINPYLIINSIYEFLKDEELPLRDGIHLMKNIESMSFNKKEQNLSHEEKISIIRNILNSFDINMIFEYDENKLSNEIIESIFGIPSKKELIDLAKYNSNLLDSKEVLSIKDEINNYDNKVLKKDKIVLFTAFK